MRLEFKAYLEKKGLPEKYFSYCNRIEDAFKGKDMDEIIITHQNISKVRTQLHTITTNEGSIDNYMVALNHYLKFAFSANKVVIRSSATPKDLVAYEKSVPSSDQISGLIEYIEKEYENIRKFAQDCLGHICQDFFGIPVYLSKERPKETYYYNNDFLLEQMKERCSKCKRSYCEPPYCNIAEVLGRYKPFTSSISGRFYGGKEPYIVLYFMNFDNPSMDNKLFLAEIAKTLAHEYMHFLHYTYADNQYTYTTKELKEAIADFFGVLYSRHCGIYHKQVAENRFQAWKMREGSNWPYAYALYFFSQLYKDLLSEYSASEMDIIIKKWEDTIKSNSF